MNHLQHVAVFSTDASGIIQVFNEGAQHLLGFEAAEIIGKHSPMLFHQEVEIEPYKQNIAVDKDPEIFDSSLLDAISHDQTRTWTYVHKDGHSMNVRLNISPIRNKTGEEQGMLVVATKVIPLLNELSELPNDEVFHRVVDREFRRCQRLEEPISLLKIDIDHYKIYLKEKGPQDTEHLLRQLASLLKDRIQRAADLLCYNGHDEFALILPHTEQNGAIKLAELLRLIIQKADIPHPKGNGVTISVGVTTMVPKRGDKKERLLTNADEALRLAKADGRNCTRMA